MAETWVRRFSPGVKKLIDALESRIEKEIPREVEVEVSYKQGNSHRKSIALFSPKKIAREPYVTYVDGRLRVHRSIEYDNDSSFSQSFSPRLTCFNISRTRKCDLVCIPKNMQDSILPSDFFICEAKDRSRLWDGVFLTRKEYDALVGQNEDSGPDA